MCARRLLYQTMYDLPSVRNLCTITQYNNICRYFYFNILLFFLQQLPERKRTYLMCQREMSKTMCITIHCICITPKPLREGYFIFFFRCLRLDICAVHCSVNKKGILTPRWRWLKNLVALFLFPIFYFYNRINL